MISAIQNESGDEAQDHDRSSDTLNQTNQGGMPLYEITEQSQRIEDLGGLDADERQTEQQLEQEIKKSMMRSQEASKMQRTTAPTRSGDLPTNPTFISVHQADGEVGDFMKSQQFVYEEDQPQMDLELDESSSLIINQQHSQQLFVWGSNSNGQLGLKDGNYGRFDVPQSFHFQHRVSMISCGFDHTAMVTETKQLYVMGSNQFAQLGMGNPSDISKCTVPTLVQSLAHIQVHYVACGARHTLAIGSEIIGERAKSCFSWGDNSKGQTGLAGSMTVYEPRRIEFPGDNGGNRSGVRISKISAGEEHSFFLDTKNWQVFACGESRQGQLGIGRRHEIVVAPQCVTALSNERIVQVAAGDCHTLALNYDGQVLATGSNSTGQLGLGHTDSQHEFCLIPELNNILHVCASSHSTAVDCDGRLFRWGQGIKGIYLAPLKIASPRPTFIEDISMGNDFGIVRNKNGELFSYGLNSSGQLGLGDAESRSTLNSLVQLNQQGMVQAMATGSNFVVCLVDTNLQPQTHYHTEDALPQTAGSRQEFTAIQSAGQKTSATEFRDSGNKEMFAILSENRAASGLSSTVMTGAFNSRHETKVSYRPVAHKVLSQQGLPVIQDFNVFGSQNNENQSYDMGTIQTHQTAQNIKESQAFRHEVSGDEYYLDVSQLSQANRQRPPRKINPKVKPAGQVQQKNPPANQTVREYARAESDQMVPPYTTSPFHASRVNLQNSSTPNTTSHQNLAQSSNIPNLQNIPHHSRAGTETTSMSHGGASSSNFQQLISGRHLNKFDDCHKEKQDRQEAYEQQQTEEESSLAEKYQLRSNFARSQSNSKSRSRERQSHRQPAGQLSDYVAQEETVRTAIKQNRFQPAANPQGLTNQYAGLDRLPVRQGRHAAAPEEPQNRHSQSPMRSHQAHQQLPSFSANVPNQFRSRSSLNLPSGRQTKGRTSMENTGQFVSQYGQKLAKDQVSVPHQHNSGPRPDYMQSDNQYQNLGGLQQLHRQTGNPTLGRVFYHQRSQSSIVEGESSSQMQTLDAPIQSHDYYGNDLEQEGCLRRGEQHQFLTSSNLNGTQTDFERSGASHLLKQKATVEQETVQLGSENLNHHFGGSREWNAGDLQSSSNRINNRRYGNDQSSQRQQQQYQPLRDYSGSKQSTMTGVQKDQTYQQQHAEMHQAHHHQQYLNHPYQPAHEQSQLQDVNEMTTTSDQQLSTNQLTSTNRMTTNTLDTFKTLEEEQQQHLMRLNNIRSKSSGHHGHKHHQYHAAATAAEAKHNSMVYHPSTPGCNMHLPNNQQQMQMRSFDFRGAGNRSMMTTPCNHNNVSKTPTNALYGCQQSGEMSLMTGFDQHQNQQDQQYRQNHHMPQHQHQQQLQSAPTNHHGTANSRSRSHSRCPMCRHEETTTVISHQKMPPTQHTQVLAGSTSFDENDNIHEHAAMANCQQARRVVDKYRKSSAAHATGYSNRAGLIPQVTQGSVKQHNHSQTRQQYRQQQREQHDRKIRKKYKKLKQDSSRAILAHQQDAEKLKLRIHELQSMLQQKEVTERKNDMKKSEGYQGLVHKYTQEVSSLQEQNCQLERTLVARESQLKIVTKENEDHMRQCDQLKSELQRIEQENEKHKTRASILATEVDGLKMSVTEKERGEDLLRQQLEQKTKMCQDAENSISHLNKTLEDLNFNFNQASEHSDAVMVENDQLRADVRRANGSIEVYTKQLESLRTFIEELEGNNKELVRFIDNKNFLQANDYKSRVFTMLSKQRNSTNNNVASLRAPTNNNYNDDDLSQHNNAVNETMMHNPLLQSNMSRSHSPVTRPMRREASFNDPLIAGVSAVEQSHQYQIVSQHSAEQQLVSMEDQRRMSSPLQNYGHSSVAEFGGRDNRTTMQELQYKTQQHCVRRKSPQKSTLTVPEQSQQLLLGTSANALASQSQAPDILDCRTRYLQIIERDRRETEEAKSKMPQALDTQEHQHQETENPPSYSPTRNFLATKAGQIQDQVSRYQQQRSSLHDTGYLKQQMDPRDRLRGEQTSYNAVRRQASRSISPAQILNNTREQHHASRFSNNERSISAGGGHNRSLDSQPAATNPNHQTSAHFASQDSLKVQYQKVTDNLPTFNRRTSHNQQEVRKSSQTSALVDVADQNKMKDRLPDIQSLLASSPGKSQKFQSRSKSPFKNEISPTPTGLQKKISDSGFNENVIETYQQFNSTATAQADQPQPGFPKVTSTMMRSQLNKINESLAQLKRNRIQLEGQMVHYEVENE